MATVATLQPGGQSLHYRNPTLTCQNGGDVPQVGLGSNPDTAADHQHGTLQVTVSKEKWAEEDLN